MIPVKIHSSWTVAEKEIKNREQPKNTLQSEDGFCLMAEYTD